MANESGGIQNLDNVAENIFPGTGAGKSPRQKLIKWFQGKNVDGNPSRFKSLGGVSLSEGQAQTLVNGTPVGILLSIYNGAARGTDFALTGIKDIVNFFKNPGEKSSDELKQFNNRLLDGLQKVNPSDKGDEFLERFRRETSEDTPADLDINRIVPGESVDERARRQEAELIAKDDARVAAGNNSKGIAGIDIGNIQFPEGGPGDVTYLGKKEQGSPEFVEQSQPGSTVTEAELIARDDERVRVTNPATGEKWTKEEIAAEDKKRVIQAATDELESRPGYIGDNSVMSQFDVGGNREGKTNIPDGKLSARESETMRGGGIFPNMGANRQEYGGGNYGPSSGFDTMSNYFWPMALNDAAKRGEDVSSPEGIKSVFDQTFPGGDYNKFKYSSGPGALAFFGVDSLGFDGKPKKSKGKSRILNSEGKEVDNIEWYEYDPITHEGLFTEAGLEKFKAANPGVTPPVGVKKTNAATQSKEPVNNSSEEVDDGLNPDGSRNLPPIPRPNKDGNCPSGYYGIDTNGDGFIDTCVPRQSDIPGAVDTKDQGMAGRTRDNPSDNLQEAAGKAALDIYNDPTNFMRFQPSGLQMMDPRYYGIKSFVPRGEQQDFNFGYKNVPGQQYVNYPETKMAAYGGLMTLADGGSTSYPRMNGQIAGPGTEKSDDIPAMLSDGEFVVNAAAVRGIGNLMGRKKPKSKVDQRREGARTMYALQKAGEQAARMG